MVKLQKLVLRNFKSFRKADIPISKGFTAIIGSNGSGKTNILDGLLFALGISSMKMLRVSRIDELVNNNAVENYAKAELALRDGNRTYVIQRMIDKQGKSIYRLDGKRKTRNEIASLLLELGIRAGGHNIVVQGDTTRIIEMSSLERRQIIDELAGLQEFDEKKEEALKELQKVDNKLRDAGIVLQERENYLQELMKDKEAADQFESLEKDGKRIKATLLFSEIESIEKSEKECDEKLVGIREEKAETEAQIEKTLAEKNSLREKSDELNKNILRQREEAYATFGAQLEEAKTEKALLQQRLENRESLLRRDRARAEQLREKAKKMEQETQNLKKRVEEIASALAGVGKKIKGAAERKAALQRDAEQREKKLAEMNEKAEAVSEELASLGEKMLEKNSLLGGLQKELELKKKLMRETTQTISETEANVSLREKKAALLSQLRKKYGGIDETLRKVEKRAERALEDLKECEAERKNLAEGIGLLGKSGATCPVCESELKKEKKEAIAGKKEARLKETMAREQILKQTKDDLQARIAEMRDAFEKEKLLSIETSDLPELRERLHLARESLLEIKKWLSLNSLEKIRSEAEAMKQKREEKKASLTRQKEAIMAFQASLRLEAFHEANSALNKIEKLEHSLVQERENLLNNEAKRLQSQREEALAEASALEEENERLLDEKQAGEKKMQRVESKIALLESKVVEAEGQRKAMTEEKEKVDKGILKEEEKSRLMQARLRAAEQQENSLMVEKSKHEVRVADLMEEASNFEGIERIKEFDAKQLNERLKQIGEKIEALGAINMKALESFNQLEAEVVDVRKKAEKLDEERLAVVEMIEKIDVKRTNVFMECFNELNKNFSKMFNTLFDGEGMLELNNKESPLEAGLLIQAKHKGNSIKNIDSMSGGEKTLTALAFLFAIQLYEPAPFYVFDEADAALDKENSAKMANIIKEVSKQSQFIAITHNDPLIQEADQIIGVALNKQKSSVIGLKLREKLAQQAA